MPEASSSDAALCPVPGSETAPDELTVDLLRRARDGGRAELAELFERVQPALWSWVHLRTNQAFRHRVDPSEVVQETWLRALERLPELDARRTSFRPWIFGVARFVLIEVSRRLARGEAVGATASGSNGLAPILREPDPATGVSTRVARREALGLFLERAAALDERDRELVVLHGLEGRTFEEVAEVLDGNAESLGRRWRRLRKRLAEEGPPDLLS